MILHKFLKKWILIMVQWLTTWKKQTLSTIHIKAGQAHIHSVVTHQVQKDHSTLCLVGKAVRCERPELV